MSKIQAKPFIQLVIESLGDKKSDLLDLVNGSEKTPEFRSLINANALITGSDKNKVQYVVLETWNKTYTGYLIYNNSYCVLVAFSNNTQSMQIVNIDLSKQTYSLVKEDLSILEFRMYLQEADDHIVASEIDSGEAQEGLVLTADGEGGASWENMSEVFNTDNVDEGDAVKLFGFDENGKLVQDDVPEGILVDDSILEDSPNAVAGGAVYDALQDVDEELDSKANIADLENGQLVPSKALQAQSIEPVSEDSGAVQDDPFVYQGTGTANGSAAVDTSPVGKQLEKQGNSIVVNQNVENAKRSKSFTTTSTEWQTIDTMTIPSGHKVLLLWKQNKTLTSAVRNTPMMTIGGLSVFKNATENYNLASGFYCWLVNLTGVLSGVSYWSNTPSDNFDITDISLIDLTQWFGSNDNIPQDILDNPENFFRYYNGSLAYNEGTLATCDGQYLVCGGRNVWDEEWEQGSLDSQTGENEASTVRIRSKNYIRVIPGATYYYYQGYLPGQQGRACFYDKDKNFILYDGNFPNNATSRLVVIPPNACYMRFSPTTSYGNAYRNDITLSLYYETGDSYDQYYPYEQPKVYDTGNETLRSAGSVKDYKTPDGTVHRLVSVVDLGSLNYSLVSHETYGNYFAADVSALGIKKISGEYYSTAYPLLSSMYVATSRAGIINNDKCVCADGSASYVTQLQFKNSAYNDAAAFKTAMSGVYLYYELAEPTTEQGTPFSENIEINDYGTMGWLDDNNAYVEIPQGCKIFYPADYVLFIDSLGEYCDWAADKLALKEDIPTDAETFLTSLPGYDASKTQTLKNVNGAFTWVDDE